MIIGAHSIVYSRDAEADRAFLRDVLKLTHVDAGHGWLIFGLPPVVRLTTLGLRQVPEHVKEAARAYGATPRQLLFGVELPLARASIMAGVNQTILMCLSMVVVASLIGAQGLGSIVLEALQYAASGQGVLAGLAILLCAVVIDRTVQATFRPNRNRQSD